MRRYPVIVAIAAMTLLGCNKERMPYLGYWHGGFDVQSSTAAAPTSSINLRGYVQLYRTEDKFEIELSNPVQVMDVGGRWKMLGPNRIELTPHEFRINQKDIDKLKALRKPFIEPEVLRSAYSKPLVLNLQGDGKTLDGLLMRVGPLLGKHRFEKGQ